MIWNITDIPKCIIMHANNENRMKYVFLFLYFIAHNIFCQNTLKLNTVSFAIENPTFYIERIVDDRFEKHLGIHKDKDGNKTQLRLFPDFEAALTSFVKQSIPIIDSKKAVIIKIKELQIQESRVNEAELIARVSIHLIFYIKKDNHLKEIYQIQHQEDEIFEASIFSFTNAEQVFDTHEQRIRAAMEYCLLAFAENEKRHNGPIPGHFDNLGSAKKKNKSLNQWYNIISYRQILTSTYHEGWALGYTGFLDNDRSFIVPYELNFEQYRVKEDFAFDEGYGYVDSYVLRPGLFGYKKIVPGVYAAMGINVPIGVEALKVIEGDERYKFLVGVGASQGVKIIPWKEFGIVIGVEFFQQIQNSEIYKRDIGLELTFGVNF